MYNQIDVDVTIELKKKKGKEKKRKRKGLMQMWLCCLTETLMAVSKP